MATETTKVKMEMALEAAKKHPNQSVGDCLYDCGIEKEDTASIMLFLSQRIEDQYYSHAPSDKTKAFINQLKEMSTKIGDYIIM